MRTQRRLGGWSRLLVGSIALMGLGASGCAPSGGACPQAVSPGSVAVVSTMDDEKAISGVLDAFHAAAAAANEEAYFGHLAEGAVFLGTDITERWDKKAFRDYAHPHFAKGKAWSFRAIRRAVVIAPGGLTAWFDEDLETARLGPARGSGALVKQDTAWKITLYNLSIPIPNDRFDEVKKIIAGDDKASPPTKPD